MAGFQATLRDVTHFYEESQSDDKISDFPRSQGGDRKKQNNFSTVHIFSGFSSVDLFVFNSFIATAPPMLAEARPPR